MTHSIILLSGPSIAALESRIAEFSAIDAVYYAINRKQAIESAILSKIGRKVQRWVMFSPDEMVSQIDNARDFLDEAQSQQLITSQVCIDYVRPRLGREPLGQDPKIVYADQWLIDVYRYYFKTRYNEEFEGLKDMKRGADINTLFMLLYGLMSSTSGKIYLFGCDGAQSPDQQALYYAQPQHYSAERLGLSRIHADMKCFEEIWPEYAAHFGWDRSRVLNVNPASHYTVFPRISIDEALAQLR